MLPNLPNQPDATDQDKLNFIKAVLIVMQSYHDQIGRLIKESEAIINAGYTEENLQTILDKKQEIDKLNVIFEKINDYIVKAKVGQESESETLEMQELIEIYRSSIGRIQQSKLQ